jgi:dethiobiotin synthetase
MPSVATSPFSMPALFITGTGTDIGKTFVCSGLIRHLRAASRPVRALKPIVSGFDLETVAATDTGLLLMVLGEPVCERSIAAISPWRFAAPLSPNMAARAEGRCIEIDEVVAFCERARTEAGAALVLIEGVGGLMVPLDERHTVLDWIARLHVPVLLVAGSYLGAISHTLTCVEVLRARNLLPVAVLINESADGVSLAATAQSVASFADPDSVVTLSRSASAAECVATYERVLALVT